MPNYEPSPPSWSFQPPSPLSRGVSDELAWRARIAGMSLFLLDQAGHVVFRDSVSAPFFQRYAIPALLRAELGNNALVLAVAGLTPQSPSQVWRIIPGLVLAAVPLVEDRNLVGALVLAGKDEAFALDEKVLSVCQILGMESDDLARAAAEVLSQSPQRLCTDADLFLSMLRDRLNLCGLERELNALSNQLANSFEELTLIDQISGGMRVNRASTDFFRQACHDVMKVMSIRGMGVALLSDVHQQPPVIYGDLRLSSSDVQRLSEQLLTDLQRLKSNLLVPDLLAPGDYRWLASCGRQLIAVPVTRGERLLGCLFGIDKTVGEFDSVDAKLLTSIANASAIYLENAMLFGDVHDLMMGLLHSLISAMDAKDPYTCGHSERVALLARHLAMEVGRPAAEVECIYMAGLLHDVGKIGVPESVLQKTGRLTPEEYELVKKHPVVGAGILSDIKQLRDVVPGVMHHHERYDGHGYPAGLAGRDIPLMGRVICLADCFDAMTSSRTYRQALPLEVALTEIRRCSGTQFDPFLAEVFLHSTPDQFRQLMHDHQHQAKQLLGVQQTLRAA